MVDHQNPWNLFVEEDQKTEEGSKREGIVLRVDFLFFVKECAV